MTRRLAALAGLALALAAGAAAAGDAKLRIATEGAYPPFNWIDKDGALKGFDVDIAKALCEAASFDCGFVVQDWDGLIPGLLARRFDVIVASMSITEERRQVVAFTDRYYRTPARFAAPEAFAVPIPADLAAAARALDGLAVGVQRATVHEHFMRDNFPGARLKTYGTQDEANLDLASGRIDLVLADAVVLKTGFLDADAGGGFKFVGPAWSDPRWFGEGIGIAVRKTETALKNALDKAIADIRADGTYDRIARRYFDFDIYGG